MNKIIAVSLCLLLNSAATDTNQGALLPDSVVAALSRELSGETAKSNLEYIAVQWSSSVGTGVGVLARAGESIRVIEAVK